MFVRLPRLCSCALILSISVNSSVIRCPNYQSGPHYPTNLLLPDPPNCTPETNGGLMHRIASSTSPDISLDHRLIRCHVRPLPEFNITIGLFIPCRNKSFPFQNPFFPRWYPAEIFVPTRAWPRSTRANPSPFWAWTETGAQAEFVLGEGEALDSFSALRRDSSSVTTSPAILLRISSTSGRRLDDLGQSSRCRTSPSLSALSTKERTRSLNAPRFTSANMTRSASLSSSHAPDGAGLLLEVPSFSVPIAGAGGVRIDPWGDGI